MLVGKSPPDKKFTVYNDEGDPAKSWWKQKRWRGSTAVILSWSVNDSCYISE